MRDLSDGGFDIEIYGNFLNHPRRKLSNEIAYSQ